MSLLQSLRALSKSKTSKVGLGEWHANQMGYRKMDRARGHQPSSSKEFQDRIFRYPEWTKPEEDLPYLRPLIDQVESELSSKQAFDNLTIIPESLKNRNRST
ncbi:hypothetical protein BC829DRAFT_400957 [Chytridium lagenaria]|nr:hypothetical protein BC829DRAFT_400957 [Chytridium lagenaria]